jgi:anthranilate phosphoribosyltransferase
LASAWRFPIIHHAERARYGATKTTEDFTMPDSHKITAQEALQRTIEHREIFHDEMLHVMRLIMSGEMSPVMMASLITGLRVKKETIGEITAAAQVMREFSTKVNVVDKTHLVDIVGTGGDGSHTFNISTCAMFVAAAAGARVSKHGGRSVSSKSGSADVLEALSININLPPEAIARCIEEVGIGFMFAPNHHPAMKNVAPIRKELGVRTIFNILGPLTNPAGAPNILMGVFHPDLVGIQIRALQRLGADHALVRKTFQCRWPATALCVWRPPSNPKPCCSACSTTSPARRATS